MWSVRGNQSAHLLVGVAFQALHKQFIVSIDEGIYNTGGLHRTGEDTPLEDTSTSPTNIKAPPPPKKERIFWGSMPWTPLLYKCSNANIFHSSPPNTPPTPPPRLSLHDLPITLSKVNKSTPLTNHMTSCLKAVEQLEKTITTSRA